MKIKVSVITVCLNSAKTIEQTIRSVIEQSYPNIEYIIIDGGSSDGTLDIIRKYEKHIACWVSEPDSGIYDAMNKGIAKATGDIIGIINSDDWYADEAISIVAQYFAENHKVEMVHGDLVNVYDDGLQQTSKAIVKETAVSWYLHPTVFIKKTIYEKYGIFNLAYHIAADAELMLRFRYAGVRVAYIPKVLSYFCHGGISTSRHWKTLIETRKIVGDSIIKYHFSIQQIDESMHFLHQNEFNIVFQYIRMRMIKAGRWQECLYAILRMHGKKSYILWGAGNDGALLARAISPNDEMLRFFVDKDVKKQEQIFFKKIVHSPIKISRNELVLVATQHYEKQICIELEQEGYCRYIDYLTCKDFWVAVFAWYIRRWIH